MRMLLRTSFTTRLFAVATAIVVLLLAVDYVALLQIPSRIARDTVEIALRENVQSLNATIRTDQEQLVGEADQFVKLDEVREAILTGNRITLAPLVEEALGASIRFRFISASEIDKSGVGSIFASISVSGQSRARNVVFFRPFDDALLTAAADAAGGEVSFALESENRFIARGAAFPRSIAADTINASIDSSIAELTRIEVEGTELSMYSRTLTSDSSYQLHALSSAELEETALNETRSDVRTAVISLTLATIASLLLLAYFVNRSVGSFGTRVRALASGDFSSRLPVRGRDAFADLAGSVNSLSVQLEDRIGRLRDSASAFRMTLETLEEGICVWDEGGVVTYWNRGAEQLTGVPRERVEVSDRIVTFLAAERAPGTRRVTLPVLRSGAGLVVDLVVTTMPDGGVLQTFRDTTMLDMLQQTQRNFMATAAHELRTPITAILGFADTLVNPELQLSDDQRDEFIGIIRQQSHQLQEIAEAFFTNHQLANERVEVSIAPTSIAAVCSHAMERVGVACPKYADRLADVEMLIDDEAVALADQRALVGVVAVLLENALKYGAAPITVTTERSGGTIALLVRDSGPGIDPYHQNRIFDPFYRIDVDMRAGVGGAGLGLFTVRKLVEAMMGAVQVRSSPGNGATFIVELPAGSGDARIHAEDDESELRLVV